MKMITATELKSILDQHKLWVETKGKQGVCADLAGADLEFANLSGANLSGANLYCAYLNNAIGLPDISWIEPGILVQLNNVYDNFYVNRKCKQDNFIQDSIGIFIQNNPEDKTIDMLVGDRIIRNIPDWVKYSGMKQFTKESV